MNDEPTVYFDDRTGDPLPVFEDDPDDGDNVCPECGACSRTIIGLKYLNDDPELPVANKYGFWTNEKLSDNAEAWLGGATQHPGSWWTDWQQWVDKHGGGKVAARVPGKGKLKAIEDAPGSYVSVRLDGKAGT